MAMLDSSLSNQLILAISRDTPAFRSSRSWLAWLVASRVRSGRTDCREAHSTREPSERVPTEGSRSSSVESSNPSVADEEVCEGESGAADQRREGLQVCSSGLEGEDSRLARALASNSSRAGRPTGAGSAQLDAIVGVLGLPADAATYFAELFQRCHGFELEDHIQRTMSLPGSMGLALLKRVLVRPSSDRGPGKPEG